MVTAAMRLRPLLLGRKAMTNIDSILRSRDITLPKKVHVVKVMVFPVVMYGCESCTIKKAEQWRIDAFELWCSLNVQVKDPILSFKIPSMNTTEVMSTFTEPQVDPCSPRGLVWPFYKKNPEWVISTVLFHPPPLCLTMNKSLKSFGFCSPSILT